MTNLQEKINTNKEILVKLENKQKNLEKNISDLKKKIANQEHALMNSKEIQK